MAKAISLKASDVHEAENIAGIDNGTPIIMIEGTYYSLETITAIMALSDGVRGFPRSVVLEAMRHLAGYEVKSVRKDERDQAVREAEEARLKAQEEVIRPLLAEIADPLSAFAEGLPEAMLTAASFRVSFKTGILGIDIETGIDPDVLAGFAKSLDGQSIGLRYNPSAESEADRWVPSLKSGGTRSKGSYALIDGQHRINPGKGKGAGGAGDFRFLVRRGRIYVDGQYVTGEAFLLGYTTETGNADNPTRPFSQPSKRVSAVTAWERDLSASDNAMIDGAEAAEDQETDA